MAERLYKLTRALWNGSELLDAGRVLTKSQMGVDKIPKSAVPITGEEAKAEREAREAAEAAAAQPQTLSDGAKTTGQPAQ